MLDWLKKLGGSRPFENGVGLETKALSLLTEDLAALEKVNGDLPNEVLRYVLDGVGEEVVSRLAATNGVGEALGFVGTLYMPKRLHDTPRGRFFESVPCSDPQFFIRLGKVYEAAWRQAKAAITAQMPHVTLSNPSCFETPGLEWLEILLPEAFQLPLHVWPARCRPCPALNAEMVEAILRAEGHTPDLLVRAAFQNQLHFGLKRMEPVFEAMTGLADVAVRHKPAMLAVLNHADFKQRIYALGMMKKCKVPIEAFLEELVGLALSSSKQVREPAAALLADVKEAGLPLIQRKILKGTNEEKALAVALLHSWEGEQARAFLESRLAEEKNKKVLRAIEEALAVPASTAAASAAPALELPPLAPMPSHAPLGTEIERAWHECFQKVNAAIAKINARLPGAPHARVVKLISHDTIRTSFALMQTAEKGEGIFSDLFYAIWKREITDPIHEFWQRPELNLVHLVRFLIQLGALRADRQHDRGVFSYGYWLEHLLPVFRRTHPEVGLRELGAAFTAVGLDARRIAFGLLQSYQEIPVPLGLPLEKIWPYWAENLDLLEQAFEPATGGFMDRYYQRQARRNAFHALASFTQPPERLVPVLWKNALGGKSERPPAQRCLEALPDKFDRLIAALSAAEAESRLAAAEWLGRTGDTRAVDALLAALKREKNESAKGAMMTVLELLGAPVEQFLDRQALLKEAEKGAAKGVPEDLKWFPFESLPVVHWLNDEQPVEPVILKWWLIQGFKLKNPAPGPLLRKYCASLKPAERETLGQFVLEAWLGEDTSPVTRAEAEQLALQQAQQYVQWSQSSYWPQNSPKKTLEEYYADFLPGLLLQPKGSAVSSKGVLSLAGACAGAAAAPAVGRYLKQWYGIRAAQCRALLQMLAWVEHKTATQLLLAVGSRFRTRSIQEEANKQAAALAERKGWTVAELADRTIPTAGLDEEGVLTFDFGPRQFTVKLNEDLELALTDADGKPLKSLPDPRKDDDEAKAAEAKKMLAAARKELKSVLTMQRDRLYEAMCTQRTWPFEDWNLYLNRHPIARHHCQRLVWAVVHDEKAVALFRPLPDGSLTDAKDDPMTLKPEDLVRVAHECQITPEQSVAWRLHLKDYEVEPLFEQFGRPTFDLAEERKQEDELTDFRGHILEAFKLRGRASKLGYTRGQTQDGGWFYDYHKRFPTLGMEAVLEFTGNGLLEENHTVAMTTFRFERVAPEGEPDMGGARMSLGEVPSVLLSECWNDLRQIAAEGPGFDPDWEKKTQM